MKKKIFVALLSVVICSTFASCGSNDTKQDSSSTFGSIPAQSAASEREPEDNKLESSAEVNSSSSTVSNGALNVPHEETESFAEFSVYFNMGLLNSDSELDIDTSKVDIKKPTGDLAEYASLGYYFFGDYYSLSAMHDLEDRLSTVIVTIDTKDPQKIYEIAERALLAYDDISVDEAKDLLSVLGFFEGSTYDSDEFQTTSYQNKTYSAMGGSSISLILSK